MSSFAKTHTNPGFSTSLFSGTLTRLKQQISRARTRRMLRELDDHQLADIGLTRHDLG